MDVYDEILKNYYNECKKAKDTSEMQNNLLIKFLNDFSNKLDVSLIKNGIILIMALSSDTFHDGFHLDCKFINKLKMNEKNEVISILKSEFSNRTDKY